jgi:putative nucleotidyltransferase with HDIG domain
MMHVRIKIEYLKVGMYIHKLEIAWMQSPFWRKHFLVGTISDIEDIKATGVRHVIIDDSKGVGLEHPDEVPDAARPAFMAPGSTPLHKTLLTSRERAAEIRKASNTLKKSKAAVMAMFSDARMGKTLQTHTIAPLVNEISSSISRDPSIILNIARLKSKDEYTYLHSVSVCALMINLARTLKLDEHMVQECGMAGLLHDVGKMAVPDDILSKPGKLDDDEFVIVRNHPARGHEMLSNSKNVSAITLDVCLHHHEKMDGTGYPDKLNADVLSLPARMAAICDVYDAVTSQRSYNVPWSASEALQKMQSWSGHFDQLLLRSFVQSLGILPVGTLVRLNNETLGFVTGENANEYGSPSVRIFRHIERSDEFRPMDVQIKAEARGLQVISIEDPADWGYDEWPTSVARMTSILNKPAAAAQPANQHIWTSSLDCAG